MPKKVSIVSGNAPVSRDKVSNVRFSVQKRNKGIYEKITPYHKAIIYEFAESLQLPLSCYVDDLLYRILNVKQVRDKTKAYADFKSRVGMNLVFRHSLTIEPDGTHKRKTKKITRIKP
jgi:hypothetical protein